MKEEAKELISQIHTIVLTMLCDIDDYCRKSNLTYYLSGGSCLGAIRNKGFIPWDDDADIMLPREDYEKFLVGFSEFYKEKYKVGSLGTDEKWIRPSARIWDRNTILRQTKIEDIQMGVFVDIFPIDGLPASDLSKKIFYMKLRGLNILRNTTVRKDFYSYEKYRLLKKILALYTRGKQARTYALKMDNLAKKYSFTNSDKVAVSLAIHYWDRETIRREAMMDAEYVEFEGYQFPVPRGYDEYLKNLYGDYMQIPEDAEEKGYTHLEGWNIEIIK